jgi:hypothetical protein
MKIIEKIHYDDMLIENTEELNYWLRVNPNYEVKEMKYEIDGVKSTKKVLVEKELEVA